MARNTNLGGDGRLLVGEDKDVVLEVLDRDGDPVDTSGWTTSLVISTTLVSAALMTKSGSVGGTFDADRATNTQRITFALTDDETATLTAGTYQYSIKRTDAGSEAILSWGKCIVETANQT